MIILKQFTDNEKKQLKTIAEYMRRGHAFCPKKAQANMFDHEGGACALGCVALIIDPKIRKNYLNGTDGVWHKLRTTFSVLNLKISSTDEFIDYIWKRSDGLTDSESVLDIAQELESLAI